MTLMTVTSFWVSDVRHGVWTESVGAVGISFRDGYLHSTLGVPDKKAFKHTGGLASIVIQNVQSEGFDSANDILVGQIRSEGYIGFGYDRHQSGSFAAILKSGEVALDVV